MPFVARLRSVVVSYPPTEAIELRRVEIGGFDTGRSVDDWGYPIVRFHDVEPCEYAFLEIFHVGMVCGFHI